MPSPQELSSTILHHSAKLADAAALETSAALGIVGGGIYHALLAHRAVKGKVETIYSWNARYYAQCGPEITRRVRTP